MCQKEIDLIFAQERLIVALNKQLSNYKEIVNVKDAIILDYESRMKQVADMIPALI